MGLLERERLQVRRVEGREDAPDRMFPGEKEAVFHGENEVLKTKSRMRGKSGSFNSGKLG
jgi:hypothetical protein